MQAVLRVEGANIIPFTANNLNIFVTAVVTQLPNITARDIVISQVCSLSLLHLSIRPVMVAASILRSGIPFVDSGVCRWQRVTGFL